MSIAEKLTTIAENQQRVYEAGKAAGGGIYYDEFWDAYQDCGERTAYHSAFSGSGWNNETFKPKYDINPTNASSTFYYTSIAGDLVEILASIGVALDFSKTTTAGSVFNQALYITRLGVMNFSSSAALSNTFHTMSALETIDLLVLRNDGNQSYSNVFTNCTKLVNLTVEGIIGKDGFNVQWSTKLSRKSIESILSCLSKETSGLTVTLSLAAVNKAFETSENALDGSSSREWTALVAEHTNWTVTLI